MNTMADQVIEAWSRGLIEKREARALLGMAWDYATDYCDTEPTVVLRAEKPVV